jgi:low temperature requirement protein LtrA
MRTSPVPRTASRRSRGTLRGHPSTKADQPTLDEASGVTTLELFFDLVFVFALTQLTSVVRHAHGPADVVRAGLVLVVLWWMYDGFAWLTNNVATASVARRLMVLLGMGGFLVAAVAVPGAFGDDGVIFGVAYLGIVLLHAGMFTLAQSARSARAILGILPFNLGCALLVLAAGWTHGATALVLWGAAVAVLVAAMAVRSEAGFELRPAHFAERHGLILIIALGESVVDLGVGAEGRLHEGATVFTALLALALAGALWWLYFERDDEAGAQSLAGTTAQGQTRVALFAYSIGILVMVAGIILAAAGLETAVAHPHEHLSAWASWSIAAGTATYLLGLGLFRRLLRLPAAWLRPAAALPVLACAVLGFEVNGASEVAAITLLLVATIALDRRTHMGFTADLYAEPRPAR